MSEQITQIIAYGIPVIALIISIFTYYAAVKERHHKSAAEAAGLKKDIESIKEDVTEIKDDLATLTERYHDNKESIIKLEGRVATCEAKIKDLEREVHNG